MIASTASPTFQSLYPVMITMASMPGLARMTEMALGIGLQLATMRRRQLPESNTRL